MPRRATALVSRWCGVRWSIMAGGSDVALESANSLLLELADPAKLYRVVGGVGAGSNMKMVHQVLAACQILNHVEFCPPHVPLR